MAESMSGMKRTHRCAELSKAQVGQTVTVMGWVQKRRNLGSLIFIDLRDRSGLLQVVFDEPQVGSEGFEKALAEYLFSANHKSCEKAVVKKVKIKHEDILMEATEKVTEQQMYIDFLEKKVKKLGDKNEALLEQFSNITQEYVELRRENDCLRAENLEMRLIFQKLRF